MTRPGKIPTVQAGIEPRIFRSRGARLNHLANEAVTPEERDVNSSNFTKRIELMIIMIMILFL